MTKPMSIEEIREKIKDIHNNPQNYRNEPFKMGDITCDDYHLDIVKVIDQILNIEIVPERGCPRCKGNKVIPVSLIYGKINKVNERLCPNCNGTGKVTVEQAIKEKME